MARSRLSLYGRCRRQRGYLLLEVLLGLLLTVVLATLVFIATGAIAYSFGRLQDELQLQETKRHILTQLEKIICYDAQRVIRLQENGQITCTMIDACKRVTIYSDKQGLYKKTRKNNGTGVNPVSLEGVVVTGWRIQRCSPQLLCISFNLSRNGRQLQVKRYLICYNARIADDV